MAPYLGKAVYKGIVSGPVAVWKSNDSPITREKIMDPTGETGAAIFKGHQLMLEDEEYLSAIRNMINTDLIVAAYGRKKGCHPDVGYRSR